MAADMGLHAFDLDGFWMDVGQPKDFLLGTGFYLTHLQHAPADTQAESMLASGDAFIEPVLVHPTAKIGNFCKIGPNVVIGPNVTIGDGVRLVKTVVMDGTRVDSYSWISSSIIGWHSRVGRWTRLEGVTVLGDDVTVNDEIYINGGSILPHKSISTNVTEPQIIM